MVAIWQGRDYHPPYAPSTSRHQPPGAATRHLKMDASSGQLSLWASEPLTSAPCPHVTVPTCPLALARLPTRQLTRGFTTLSLQLRKPDMQERPAFGGEDARVLGRRELHAVALGELGALDGISAEQEHRADMLQDVLIGLR